MSLNLLTTEQGSFGFSCVEIYWKERLQLSLEDAFWCKWVQVLVFHFKYKLCYGRYRENNYKRNAGVQ